MSLDPAVISDIIELQQLLARYAVGMTKDDVDAVVDVFTPDGTYSAFGDTYALADFPRLVAAAPTVRPEQSRHVSPPPGDAGSVTRRQRGHRTVVHSRSIGQV